MKADKSFVCEHSISIKTTKAISLYRRAEHSSEPEHKTQSQRHDRYLQQRLILRDIWLKM